MEVNTEAGNMYICYHYFAKFPHPWKFCHFWIAELQSRADHVKLGRYLRNVDRMGLDFCMVRNCGSAATMQTHLSPVHYRNLLSNVLTASVFVTGVNNCLPIYLNRCWPTPLSSLSLYLALLSHAATFILSVLGCTSRSMTNYVISGFCHLDNNIRTAKLMICQFSSELVCLMKILESLWLTEQKVLEFCSWLLNTRSSYTIVPLATKITR